MGLEERIEILERVNRRLTGVLSAIGVSTVLVSASAFSVQNEIPDVITARRFELRGDVGDRLLGSWAAVELAAGVGAHLLIVGDSTDRAVSLIGGPGGAGLILSSYLGRHSLTPMGLLVRTGGTNAIGLHAKSILQEHTNLTLEGPNGEKAVLGMTSTVNPRTGATTKLPVSTLTLYDAEGFVLRQIP